MSDTVITQQQTSPWTYWTPSSAPSTGTITSPGLGGLQDSVSTGGSTGGTAPPSYMQDINNPALVPPVVVNGVVTIPTQVAAYEAQYSLQKILNDPSLSQTDILAITLALSTGDRSQLTATQATVLAGLDQEVHDNQTFEQTLLTYIEQQMPGASKDQVIECYNQILSAYYSGAKGFADSELPQLNNVTISQVLGTVQTLANSAPKTPVQEIGNVSFESLSQHVELTNLQQILTENKSMISNAKTLTTDPSTLDLMSIILDAVSKASQFLNELITLNQKNSGLYSKADYESTKSKMDYQIKQIEKQIKAAKKAARLSKKLGILQKCMIAVAAVMIVCTCGTMTGAALALSAFVLITVDQQCNKSGTMDSIFKGIEASSNGIAAGLAKIGDGMGIGDASEIKNKIDGPMKLLFVAALVMACTYFGGGAGLALAMGPAMDQGGAAEEITKFWASIDPNPIFSAIMTAVTVLILAVACGRLIGGESAAASAAKADAATATTATGAGAVAGAKSIISSNPLATLRASIDDMLTQIDDFFFSMIKQLKTLLGNLTKSNPGASSSVSVTAADSGATLTPIQKAMMRQEAINRMMALSMFLQGAGQTTSSLIDLRLVHYQQLGIKAAGELKEEIAIVDAVHKLLRSVIQSLLSQVSGDKGASGQEGSSGLTADLESLQNTLVKSTFRSMNLDNLYRS